MRLATHNLLFLFDHGTHTHSGKEWVYTPELIETRVKHFGDLFSSIAADIVFLQELASEDVLKRIIARSGIEYAYFLGEPDVNGVGNAVLYKGLCQCSSIQATSELPIFVDGDKDTLGPRVFSRRDFVCVKTSVNSKPILMLGLHFKAGFLVGLKDSEGKSLPMRDQLTAADGLIRSEVFRFAQARKVREVVDTFLAENGDGEVIIAGDFNAREGDVPLRITQGVLDKSSGILIDAVQWLPEAERISFGGRKLVDHILLSKGIAATLDNVHILNQGEKASKDISPNPTAVGSDHPPVVIDLDLDWT